MNKAFLGLFLLVFVFPVVSSMNVSVEVLSSENVYVPELGGSVSYDIKITNYGEGSDFEFYNLVGLEMLPSHTGFIDNGEYKTMTIKVSPIGEFKQRGPFIFDYYLRDENKSEIKQQFSFRSISLKDCFEIGSGEFDSEDTSLSIYIHNKEAYSFKNLDVKFSSAFFEIQQVFDLDANKRKDFDVQLKQEDFKKLMAGFYDLRADVEVQDEKAAVEGMIKFNEKDILETSSKDYGVIVQTKVVTKENKGNVLTGAEVLIRKNIISRLFTTLSPEPTMIERMGSDVFYTWKKELSPGEELEVVVKTNWVYPILVIFFIVLIVILMKNYTKTDLDVRKRVDFVKAKGGEFALKVTLLLTAKEYLENIRVIDKLPAVVKVHPRFGSEVPKKIDEKRKEIEWNFSSLEAGERRVLTYIVYSKVGILGKFALPKTKAIYEKEGEINETSSNRAFFVSEQRKK